MADYENQNYSYAPNGNAQNNQINGPQSSLLQKDSQGLLGNSRLGFIRKVYMILGCQMLITVLMTVTAMYSEGFSSFQQDHVWLMIVAIVVLFIVQIALVCYRKVARKVPTNYILLAIFTLCMSYVVSATCSQVKDSSENGSKIVLIAAVMTLGIVVALTLYAMTTKKDFTMLGGFLFCFSMTLLIFGIFVAFSYSDTAYVIYCGLAVLLYSFYLIYDTQLIVGKGRYQLQLDDYIIGALMIYLDIILLFLEILKYLRFVSNR